MTLSRPALVQAARSGSAMWRDSSASPLRLQMTSSVSRLAWLGGCLIHALRWATSGGGMGIIGFDHAQNANVALTTYPDPESAATAAIQMEAKQLLDVVSRGMFTTMEELWPVFSGAMG